MNSKVSTQAGTPPRRKKFLRALTMVTAAASALTFVGAANASATGCTWYGDGIRGFVRNGSFCGTINGSGTYVQNATGIFGQTNPFRNQVHNASLKADFYDANGRWYTWRQSGTQWGTFWGTYNWLPTIPINTTMRRGFAYLTLQDNGTPVATVRINIG